ncbi:MAG TPA: transaldolase [Gemmatimonadaceae bacterium]|nr:transaldolase [Gemmatimonadaceae bacterium]
MPDNRLQRLHDAGQSIWLDYIDRPMLHDGELERRIRDDALTGMTSNPTIFEKALAEGSAYDAQLAHAGGDRTPWQLFELIATEDVRRACDLFAGVYDATRGGDGYVSIEVSPGAAHDVAETVDEARRLWREVGRPNVMIKVPGTPEGAVATRALLAEGINVNVTLLFSLDAYRAIIEAYLSALEERAASGRPIDHLAGVASFFVSRVDTEADKRIDARIAAASEGEKARLAALKGKTAVANAKLAYALFQEMFAGPRWQALAAKGARVQRPLWASTSTKNPAYRDVMYVEQLIGPHTVNTMPPATIEAFRDHGEVRRTVDAGLDEARRDLAALEAEGISLRDITDKLLVDGLASFAKSFDTLLAGLERKTASLATTR